MRTNEPTRKKAPSRKPAVNLAARGESRPKAPPVVPISSMSLVTPSSAMLRPARQHLSAARAVASA